MAALKLGITPSRPALTERRALKKLIEKARSDEDKQKERSGPRSENMSIPPKELRCPISLQLMYDPVIISSGQTYEHVCIKKWFGHSTCPKTQQQLSHLSTPGLISTLAMFVDTGEPTEQEQSVSCLLVMCTADDKCVAPVLQEGVVPSLVSISATGTRRRKEKSQKLLKLFQEQRQ
ncbi:hypothetical protein E2562_024955 [Oryza meyeriana var. granulata]|uniref:RING-type E3 ubiquitin transferase n=1 Tax=Oryza meyeriana var. granulata TaxID=110450 RepID=A0A6G1DN09_9ORYZ|nr:hypothetical protein E2562_024955 [Oryza meyeriana var. granulata]